MLAKSPDSDLSGGLCYPVVEQPRPAPGSESGKPRVQHVTSPFVFSSDWLRRWRLCSSFTDHAESKQNKNREGLDGGCRSHARSYCSPFVTVPDDHITEIM